MTTPVRAHWSERGAGVVVAVASTAIVLQLAALERKPPVRCPAGLEIVGGRCCGVGQTWSARGCDGKPQSCGPNQSYFTLEDGRAGCVLDDVPVSFAGGQLPPGAADWQVTSSSRAELRVGPFAIDRGEVTQLRYAECVAAGSCDSLPVDGELGLPVAGLTPAQAETFCAFAGGHVPSSAEWRFAAGGPTSRRFPWGSTGLVCRRTSFGLTTGPCSRQGSGPDLVGARPDGNSPEGLVDLAGNVAEWTRDPDGRYQARGGSFRSRVAAELITAGAEMPKSNAAHVGFRCAYATTARTD